MLTRPDEFDVIATLNLNGDYLSDALAAQVGGIGIAPGGNINYVTGHAVFEATHGTAPKYANLDKVNPGSVVLSGRDDASVHGLDRSGGPDHQGDGRRDRQPEGHLRFRAADGRRDRGEHGAVRRRDHRAHGLDNGTDPMTNRTSTRRASARPRWRALLVEDEAAIRELLRLHLELAGFDVEEIGDGSRALDSDAHDRFDLIVLDVMLPGLDGITLCRAIRAEGANADTPILMLTARDTESDKVLGLESGADDYLTKPFGIRELVARVAALAAAPRARRRHSRAARRGGHRAGDLALDRDKRAGDRARHARRADEAGIRSAVSAGGAPRASSSAGRRCWRRSGAATPTSPSAPSTRWSAGCAGRSSAIRRIPS